MGQGLSRSLLPHMLVAIIGKRLASRVPLEYRRTQSKRIRRDPANPKLHALHVDIDENGTCSILAGNEGVIGVLPTLADLGLALAQRGLDQCDESIVGVVLTDDRDPTGATQVGCLARTTVGKEPDRPLVLIGVVQ